MITARFLRHISKILQDGFLDWDAPPQMPNLVVVGELEVFCSRDNVRASGSSNSVTNMVETANVHIFRASRNEIHTFEVTTVKLVDHQTLESVSNWVNVVDPTKPWHHIRRGNHEPRVNHKRQNED